MTAGIPITGNKIRVYRNCFNYLKNTKHMKNTTKYKKQT